MQSPEDDDLICNPEAIPLFWEWFKQHNEKFKNLPLLDSCTQNLLYSGLIDQVHTYCEDLFPIIEFDIDGAGNELVITANGYQEYFDAAYALVEAAPRIEGWAVIALRPRTIDLFRYLDPHEAEIDPQTLQFLPVADEKGLTGIWVFIPDYNPEWKFQYWGMIDDMVINLVGELYFGYAAICVEKSPLLEKRLLHGLKPFLDLPDFLERSLKMENDRYEC